MPVWFHSLSRIFLVSSRIVDTVSRTVNDPILPPSHHAGGGRSVGLPFCRWCIGSARSGYGRSVLFCTSPKRGIWRKYDATKSVAQLKYLIAIDFLSYRVLVINRFYAVLSVCTLHSITITYRWWSSKRKYLLQRVTRAQFMLLYIQFLFTAHWLDRISVICMIFWLISFDNTLLFWN